jgi:hypothetical protein
MKHVALLLLGCLACTGSITGPDAEYWASGEERAVAVRLSNQGPDAWTAGETQLFVEVDGRRREVTLQRDIAVGESVIATVIARAPFGMGRYDLVLGAGSVVLEQRRMDVGCSVGGAQRMRGASGADELDIILSSTSTAEDMISAAATAINNTDITVYSDPAMTEAVLAAMAGYGPFGQGLAAMVSTLVTDHGLNVMFTDAPYNAFFDAATYGVDAVVISTTSLAGTPLSNEYMSQTLAHEGIHAAQSMAPQTAPFATTAAPDPQAFSDNTFQVEAEAEAAAIGVANEQGQGTGFASQQVYNDAYGYAMALGYTHEEAHAMATATLAATLESGAITTATPAGDPATPDGTGDPGAPDGSDGGGDDTGSGDTGSGDTGSGDTGSGDTGSGDTGSGDTGGGDTGGGDTGGGDTGGGDSGGGDSGGGDGGGGDGGGGE